MKKMISVLLTVAVLLAAAACSQEKKEPGDLSTGADLSVSQTGSDTPEQTVWDADGETTPETQTVLPVYTATVPGETTRVPTPSTTKAPAPSTTKAPANTFFDLLCSDTWLVISEDSSSLARYTFHADGSLTVHSEYRGDADERTYRDPIQTGSSVTYPNNDFPMVFSDIGQKDIIHLAASGEGDYHDVLIREHSLTRNTAAADRLAGTQWHSAFFVKEGVDPLRVSDCDVYPVNADTALLVYRDNLTDYPGTEYHARAVVVSPADGSAPQAYIITACWMTAGSGLENTWEAPERWTTA